MRMGYRGEGEGRETEGESRNENKKDMIEGESQNENKKDIGEREPGTQRERVGMRIRGEREEGERGLPRGSSPAKE